MPQKRKLLGDLLVESGVITQDQLMSALAQQKTTGERLGDVIRRQGWATEKQIVETLEFQLGIPQVDLGRVSVAPEAAGKVTSNLARKHNVVPVKLEHNMLYVAMNDPLNFIAIDDIRAASGMDVFPMLAPVSAIAETIERVYTGDNAQRAIADFERQRAALADVVQEISAANASDEVNNAPIVRLVQAMLDQAVKDHASDIHIEPQENGVRVRTRVDGMLRNTLTAPRGAHSGIVTRLKIMSGLNIAEKRVPQDGRFDHNAGGQKADIRISVLPTVHGEKVVLRILDQSSFFIPKEQLGFTQANMDKFNQLLRNPHGIVLVTGPTGSGKSTTLYTMLAELNNERDNIITIEDPVEYMLPGLNQVQVNTRANLTFATGLRAILRQDPDVIMIGEMRDAETCEIAIRAAITGHLVLSTLHTNDAVSSIPRLIDMGVEPYMLVGSIMGVISQRLVRVLCKTCKARITPPEGGLMGLGIREYNGPVYQPVGCAECNSTGYSGRIAVHEVLVIDKAMRELIGAGASLDAMRDQAIKSGMSTLRNECLRLLSTGVTSLNEVLRVAYTQSL